MADAQESLFGALPETAADSVGLTLESSEPVADSVRLAWEKELLGLYVSGHPLDAFRSILDKRSMTIKKISEDYKEGMRAVPAGLVEEIRMVTTKKGDRMAFMRLTDFTGSIEIVLFPKVFKEYADRLVPELCIAVQGRVSHRNGEPSIICENIKRLEVAQKKDGAKKSTL